MDISLLNIISIIVVPLVAWGFKMIVMNRIERLEKKVETAIDEEKVRQLIADKLNPIQDDVKDIKQRLEKILDILIANGR